MGESGPLNSQGLSANAGFRYVPVITSGLSDFVNLEPVAVFIDEVNAAPLPTGVASEACGLGLELPNSEVGDYVLYARVRCRGVTPKLMAMWTVSWRVVGAHHPHVFEIQKRCFGSFSDRPFSSFAFLCRLIA